VTNQKEREMMSEIKKQQKDHDPCPVIFSAAEIRSPLNNKMLTDTARVKNSTFLLSIKGISIQLKSGGLL